MQQNNIEENKIEKERKTYKIAVLLMLLIMTVLVGGVYAFFTARFTGVEDDTTITVDGGTLGIHMDGGNIITMNNIYPRDESWETKRFTITGNNNTVLEMEYYLSLIVTENTFQDGSLTYTLTSENTSNTGTPAQAITTQTGIPTGAGTHSLGGGIFDSPGSNMTHTYYLTFYFPSKGVPQNEDQGATFRAHVGISGEAPESPPTAGDVILENNNVREGSPNFATVASYQNRDTEEGLWRIPDEHGTAYIFRGTHTYLNNNVIFAGHQWKILRIEGNGNIRMIYNGVCPNNECTINGATAGSNATIGHSAFISIADRNAHGASAWDNRHVGYMFGNTCDTFENCHANINNSTIKTFADNWFNSNDNLSPAARLMIATDTIFCVDRSIGTQAAHNIWSGAYATVGLNSGIGTTVTTFGTVDRLGVGTGLNHFNPTLTCPREEDRLTMPIGLLTQDEASMAGGRWGLFNNDFFLRTNQMYLTMSPRVFDGGWIGMLVVDSFGILSGSARVDLSNGVRPVIALNSGTEFARGDGSLNSPFIVES